jgi:hypothetical protein
MGMIKSPLNSSSASPSQLDLVDFINQMKEKERRAKPQKIVQEPLPH